MSLRRAVELIVEDMEADNTVSQFSLKTYARLLRMALKASEGEPPQPTQVSNQPDWSKMSPKEQARYCIEMEKHKHREGKDPEQHEEQSILCMGGPADGTYYRIAASMPLGAYCEVIPGHVYSRQGDGLSYSQANSIKPQK